MRVDHDVVVIGAGLAGAAAAWQLTTRGRRVLMLESHPLGHRNGSSHGTSRIYRRAYLDPFYVALTGEAEAWWARLEAESGDQLRSRTGGLDCGDARDLAAMAERLGAHGVPHESLTTDEVAERWPGLSVPGDRSGRVLFHPEAGFLDPSATMAACLRLARAGGAEVVDETAVTAVRAELGGVVVDTAGASYRASVAVVAAGPWLPELWPTLDVAAPPPPLTVRQQEVFHFRRRDPAAVWPTFVHKQLGPTPQGLYGLPSGADGGLDPAVKIGRFESDVVTTAADRNFLIDAASRQAVIDFVTGHLPGLETEPVAEQSCLFTMTPSEDFVIDRRGPVVIASPCSGHGAKFAPLTGALIADLVDGAPPRPRFALSSE